MSRIVSTRTARQTGLIVQVIDNRDGSFDDGGLDWITFCFDHGNYCEHETRRLAESWASDPKGWCGRCGEIVEWADG